MADQTRKRTLLYQIRVDPETGEVQVSNERIAKLRENLSRAKKGSVEYAAAQKALANAQKQVGVTTAKTGQQVSKFDATVSKARRAISQYVGVISAGLIARDAINRIGDYEQALADLGAITGATAGDLEFYSQAARQVGKTTTVAASDAVKAFELIGSAKPDLLQNRDALVAVTKEAVTLAEASGLTLPDAAKSLAGALNQFNLPAGEAARVINVLAAGSKEGAAAIPAISESIERFGAVARANNVTLEQSVGLTETLAEKNIQGAEAGTQLRNIILKLNNAGLGFVDGQFNIAAALDEARQKFENISDPVERSQELTKLFGLESVTAGQILLDNTETFNRYAKAVTGTNTAYVQAEQKTETFRGAVKRLQNSYEDLILGASGVTNQLRDIVIFLADNLETIVSIVLKLVGAFVTYRATVFLVNTATKIYTVTTKAASIVSALFTKGIGGATKGFKAFNSAMRASVIGLVTTAIYALVEAVDLFSDSTETATQRQYEFNQQLQSTAELAQQAADVLKQAAIVESLDERGVQQLESNAQQTANQIKDIVNKFKADNQGAITAYEDAIAELGGELIAISAGLEGTQKEALEKALKEQGLKSVFDILFTTNPVQALDEVRRAMTGFIDGVGSEFIDGANVLPTSIDDAVQEANRRLNSLFRQSLGNIKNLSEEQQAEFDKVGDLFLDAFTGGVESRADNDPGRTNPLIQAQLALVKLGDAQAAAAARAELFAKAQKSSGKATKDKNKKTQEELTFLGMLKKRLEENEKAREKLVNLSTRDDDPYLLSLKLEGLELEKQIAALEKLIELKNESIKVDKTKIALLDAERKKFEELNAAGEVTDFQQTESGSVRQTGRIDEAQIERDFQLATIEIKKQALDREISDINKFYVENGQLREGDLERLAEIEKEKAELYNQTKAIRLQAALEDITEQEEEKRIAFLQKVLSGELKNDKEIKEAEKELQADLIELKIEAIEENLFLLDEESLRYKELTREKLELERELTEKLKEEEKERQKFQDLTFSQKLDLIQRVTDEIFRLVEAAIQISIDETDRVISAQQNRVDEVTKIADKGNVALLELEEERLRELNQQRARFVRQQQALAAIELVANSAVAIAKAAAEGGAAAPFTIAATLIALSTGLIQARALAQQSAASFFVGGRYSQESGHTGSGNPHATSSRLGRKPYDYHRDEFIFNHDKTREFGDIFQGIHDGFINPRTMLRENQLMRSLLSIGGPRSMDNAIFAKPDRSGPSMDKYFKELGELFTREMQNNRVKAEMKLDKDGLHMMLKQGQKKRQRIKSRGV